MVGLGRVELPTSRLSGVRSNQLSYRPVLTLEAWDRLSDPGSHLTAAHSIIREPGGSLKTEQDERRSTIVNAIPIDLGKAPIATLF